MANTARYSTYLFILLLSVLTACTPLIGPYNAIAYQNATSLKAETLALMDHATEPYADHKVEVERLFIEVSKAHEFVKGLPTNAISAGQWQLLIQRNGALMGTFFERWATSSSGTLSKVYINEFKMLIGQAFDYIICLEANKNAASKCAVTEVTP